MTQPAPNTAAHPPPGDVSAIVRAEVARRRVSGLQLAKALGLTQPAMSRRLRGDVPFTADQIVLVARELGIPTADLLP